MSNLDVPPDTAQPVPAVRKLDATAHSVTMTDNAAPIVIAPESAGTFLVQTAAGTDILLEHAEDGWYATRKPGMRRPQGDGHTEPLRLPGDFTRVPVDSLNPIRVGEPTVIPLIVGDQVQKVETAPITVVLIDQR